MEFPEKKIYWSGESMVSTIKAVDGGMSTQWASHFRIMQTELLCKTV